MYPPQPPWSGIGSLQGDVSNLRQELNRKADSHEIHSIHSTVDSLEHTIREISTSLDGLRSEIEEIRQNQQNTEEKVNELLDNKE